MNTNSTPNTGSEKPTGSGKGNSKSEGALLGRGKGTAVLKSKSRGKPQLSGQVGLSFSTCVRTLSGVNISRRGLLNLEMAVGLAVFLDAGVADRASKNMLYEVYAGAGYQCADSSGKDYKTVNRRIQASSALFGKIGLEVVNHWVSERKESKLLQAIAHEISTLGFSSLDDVLDYVGRTSNRTSGKIVKKTPWDIEIGDKVIRLPHKLTEAELVELSSKILELAEAVRVAGEGAAMEPQQASGGAGERRKGSVAVEMERRTIH